MTGIVTGLATATGILTALSLGLLCTRTSRTGRNARSSCFGEGLRFTRAIAALAKTPASTPRYTAVNGRAPAGTTAARMTESAATMPEDETKRHSDEV